MKTTVIDVRDLLSPLSAQGIEKQLATLPGVKQVDVNNVSGSAIVLYDETVTDLNVITTKLRECGHHCGGELLPKHLCVQNFPHDAHASAASSSPTPAAIHTDHTENTQHAESASHAGTVAHLMAHACHVRMVGMGARFSVFGFFSVPGVGCRRRGLC